MPWSETERAGFSSGQPWLPVPREHLGLSVATQERDPGSALHAFRRLLEWRKTQPALISGDIEFLAATESVLAFLRTSGEDRVLVAFNLSKQATEISLPGISAATALLGHGLPAGTFSSGLLALPGHGVAFFRV
jgi:alpha-glucosidase